MRRPLVLGQRHSTPQPARADTAPPEELSILVMPPLPSSPPAKDRPGDICKSPRWLPEVPTTQTASRSRFIGSDPLEAWRREAGLGRAEADSLVAAGFTMEDRHRWPLPDARARTLQGLPAAEKPVEPPPPGWTSLNVQPEGGPAQHFWFQPAQSERDLKRLRHGLFLLDLATDLGMPESVPQIQPFFERDGTKTVYGMLLRVDPGACPATDTAVAADSVLNRRQSNALEWLALFGNLPLSPDDMVWARGDQGLALRPRLPLEAPLLWGSVCFGSEPRPRPPTVIDANLRIRVAKLDLRKWADPGYPFLEPHQGEQLVERMRESREDLILVPPLNAEVGPVKLSPVDARIRPLSPRNPRSPRISWKSGFGKARDGGLPSPREPHERYDLDAADRLWQHLRTSASSDSLPDLSVRDLLLLASQPGLSHRAVSAALHSGAGPHDILQAHALQLPPSWPLLGSSVLDARAEELSQLPSSPAPRALRCQLQQTSPLAQVAHAVRKAIDAQPLSPRSRHSKDMGSPPARPVAPSLVQTLERHASTLFAGEALSATLVAARTFERSRASLLPIDIGQKARLTEAREKTLATLSGVSDAVVQLGRAHDRDQSPRAAAIVEQIRTRVAQEERALDQLNAAVDLLGRRIPETVGRKPTAGDLLLLQTPGGPALDYQLHGLLAGWEADDILSAHAAGWPSWFMEWSASFAETSLRLEHIAERMGKVLASIKSPSRQPH